MIRNAAKYDHIDFKPPQSVANEAEKGLEYRKKANPSDKGGLTPAEAAEQGIGSGVQRATNLKNRNNVSPEVIRQMCAFFARHEKNKSISPENKSTPWKDKGHVAWLLWGGDSGKTWAEKVRDQMDRADEKAESKTAHSLIDHELVNDLASAYRGKRMRDGIRDMEMAGMPEQVAERFYDAVGEHADEVRGELHRLIEDKGGCDCGCGPDCPCMKQRVANRFLTANRATFSTRKRYFSDSYAHQFEGWLNREAGEVVQDMMYATANLVCSPGLEKEVIRYYRLNCYDPAQKAHNLVYERVTHRKEPFWRAVSKCVEKVRDGLKEGNKMLVNPTKHTLDLVHIIELLLHEYDTAMRKIGSLKVNEDTPLQKSIPLEKWNPFDPA